MDEFERRLGSAEGQLLDLLARIADLETKVRALEQQARESRGGGG